MHKVELSVLVFLWAIAVALAMVLVTHGLNQIERTIKSQPVCFPPYIQMNVGHCTHSVPTGRENPRGRRQVETLRPTIMGG